MKNRIATVLQILVTFFIFWWIFQDLDWYQVANTFKEVHIGWLILALLTLIISLLLGALQWFILLRSQEVAINFSRTLKVYWIGLFFNNVLPGSLGGDIVKIYTLARYEKQGKKGFAATVVDRFAGLFAMVLFALSASFFLLYFGQEFITETNRYLISSTFFIFCLFIFAVFILFSQRTFRLIFDVLLGNFQEISIIQKVRDLHEHFHTFRKDTGRLIGVGLLSMAIQFLRISVHFFAALALGIPVNYFIFFLLIVPFIALAASLPISYGGAGVREKIGMDLFTKVGIAPKVSFSFEFLATLLGIIASLAGGILFLSERKKSDG
jgi:uncharacterized protein (TIRG00374 family)